MSPPTDGSFAESLALERAGDGEFVARFGGFGGASFGGDALARAVLAAAATCEARGLHALHACFLRPVPVETPVALRVERLKDGRRLAQRRVELRHADRLLCHVTASFAAAAGETGHQECTLEPVAAPEELPGEDELARAEGWTHWTPGPLEWRWIGRPWAPAPSGETSAWQGWVRPRVPLPAQPGLHAAALAWLSDTHSQWAIARRLGTDPGALFGRFTSLDHSLWAHRPPHWVDWWRVRDVSDVSHAGRAFTRRQVYTREGQLVASIAQEALVEPARDPERSG